jgi:hypothetical protein
MGATGRIDCCCVVNWWSDDELALVTMGSPHQLRISRRYRRGHSIIVRCCTCAYNGTCRAFVAASHCEYELTTDCYNVVHDPLTEDQEGCSEATVGDPTLSLPTDGDYKALPRRLMFQIMSMPSKLDGIKEGAASVWDFSTPPDYEELFEYRREEWSKLGLEALELIDALCREYKIPVPDRPKYYTPRESFSNALVEVKQERKKREEANSEMMAGFITTLPKADATKN